MPTLCQKQNYSTSSMESQNASEAQILPLSTLEKHLQSLKSILSLNENKIREQRKEVKKWEEIITTMSETKFN